MGKRKDIAILRIPIVLPADTSSVEVDYNQSAASGEQVFVTFKKDDGTRVVKKGSMPTLAETGVTMALS